jgi:hypothetical protein
LSDKLKQAIKLIQSGEKQKGGQILTEVLKTDPKNEIAWLWMSLTVTNRKQQCACLEKVLAINPDNFEAKQALAKLEHTQQKQAKLPFNQPKIVASTSKYRPNSSVSTFIDERKPTSNLALGCLGGLLATGLGAGIWAVISILTNYQIGWMAVGVGFLVGLMVKIFGQGDSPFFGFIGAVLAFAGCLIGNYMVVAILASRELGVPATELVLIFGIMINQMKAFFHPLDVVFYGIAIYEGFRFSYNSR